MADKWPEMDKGLEDRIDGLLGAMPVRRKKMFGTSAWFMQANDQMFAGVWGDGVMLRLGQEESTRLVDSGEVGQFDPMGGRPMKEYVYVSADQIAEDGDLVSWLEQGAEFAGGLSAKVKKPSRKARVSGR
ncbi:MAG: TfoX/Sxy family protein [Chloroflexi bacterium]|nr:TfoX/Sxy family protein [Chloroflexota bacterium]